MKRVWVVTGISLKDFSYESREVRVFDNEEEANRYFMIINATYDYVWIDKVRVYHDFRSKEQ